jgi:LacI family transcriptional regulator
VTIYEVAERAQVSISTVSNVLNKPDRVKQATRERVLAAVDELGFVPKVQAVHLARRGAGRIGVMAPFTSYASYLRRLAGVLGAATELELDVVVYDHESAAQATSPVLASMPIHGRLDGLIVMGLQIEDRIARRLHERELPTVAVDAESELFSRVLIDDVAGGRLAGRHFVDNGHRRFGYVLERQVSDYESQAIKRLAGFKDVVGGDTLDVVTSDNSVADARAAAGTLLDRPDAGDRRAARRPRSRAARAGGRRRDGLRRRRGGRGGRSDDRAAAVRGVGDGRRERVARQRRRFPGALDHRARSRADPPRHRLSRSDATAFPDVLADSIKVLR